MAFSDLQTLKKKDLFVSSGLVAGQWRTGKTFPVTEPSSGTVLHECANLGRQDFVDAINSGRQGAANFYQNTTAKERGTLLRRWNDLVLENQDDRKSPPSPVSIPSPCLSKPY